MKQFLISIICLVICSATFAQTPQSFQYQAVVRDAGGAAIVNHAVLFRISIISGTTTGTVEYIETHNTTTNSYGVVTLSIGSGTIVSGVFSNIAWSSAPHFMKVEADPNGGGYIDMGTSQLLGVPYAMYAEEAGNAGDTLWGLFGNNIYNKNNGNVGVGTNTPSGRMVIQGSSTAAPTDPLFEIKNAIGQQIMVVYNDSVHFFITDAANPSNRGGFAVSGRSNAKGPTNDYLKVRPDSTRIWTGDTVTGFGVKNIGTTSKTSYLQLTPKNYFIGHEAGKSITLLGEYNSFIGYQSGYKNTIGDKNYFIGYRSGYNNVSGFSNVFMGDSTGFNNSSGNKNIFIGNQAGISNISGYSNIFIGQQSGFSNNTGFYNIFIGTEAGTDNLDGFHNAFVGYQCGFQNTSGWGNSFYGGFAGYDNLSGNENVFIGISSGVNNTDGDQNVYVGKEAAHDNSNGSRNVFLGYRAGYSEVSNDRLYIESSNANSSGALIYGEFDNNKLRVNNYLGVGRMAAVNQLEVQGDASKTTAGLWAANSDKRIKTDIQDIENSFETIMKLHPVIFKYTDEWKSRNPLIKDQYYYNFIAQEFKQVFPNSVKGSGEFIANDNEEILQVDPYNAYVVSIKAIQDLIIENQDLKKEIKDIYNKLNDLELAYKASVEKNKKDQSYNR